MGCFYWFFFFFALPVFNYYTNILNHHLRLIELNVTSPVACPGTSGHARFMPIFITIQPKIYCVDFTSTFSCFRSGYYHTVQSAAVHLATDGRKSGTAANSTCDITMHHWPLQLVKDVCNHCPSSVVWLSPCHLSVTEEQPSGSGFALSGGFLSIWKKCKGVVHLFIDCNLNTNLWWRVCIKYRLLNRVLYQVCVLFTLLQDSTAEFSVKAQRLI